MAKGISISVAADTRAFMTAVTRGVIDPVEDAQKALEDVEKAGDKAGDELEKSFRDTTRETKKVERAADAMGEAIQDGARKGGRAIDREVRDGAKKAEGGLRELGDEANSTAREAAASFDGSAESIGDAFQEVAANAFAGFGPAGAVAGLAAAAGIGIVIAKLNEGGEQAEGFKEKVAALTQELIDAGTDSGPSLDYIVDRLQELATTGDDAGTTLEKLRDTADKSGRSYEDLARAYSGQIDSLDKLAAASKSAREESDELRRAATGYRGEDQAREFQERAEALDNYATYLDQAASAATSAAEAEQNYIDAGGPELEAKAERAEEYSSSIQESLGEAGSSWDEYADAESGALDLAAYNANIEARVAAMAQYQSNMQTLHGQISDDAYNYLVSLGSDAAPLLQAYADAPLDQQERTAANWATLGASASAEYKAKLEAGIPATITGPTVVVGVDDSSLNNFYAGLPQAIKGPDVLMQPRLGTRVP